MWDFNFGWNIPLSARLYSVCYLELFNYFPSFAQLHTWPVLEVEMWCLHIILRRCDWAYFVSQPSAAPLLPSVKNTKKRSRDQKGKWTSQLYLLWGVSRQNSSGTKHSFSLAPGPRWLSRFSLTSQQHLPLLRLLCEGVIFPQNVFGWGARTVASLK